MPDDYFADSQAPVIVVQQEINAYTFVIGVDRDFPFENFTTKFIGNEFIDNQNYQIVTVPELSYKGSLLEWDCTNPTSIIGLYNNTVS